jgi:lysozyme family protein
MAAFDEAVKELLKIEGGYVNDPTDRGGETNHGITVAVARANGYEGAMAAMPVEAAKAIYRRRYWSSIRLDEVAGWDGDVAKRLFDIGVNMGPRTAGRFLQRSLNLLNRNSRLFADLTVDGKVGSRTVGALKKLSPSKDRRALLQLVSAYQGRRYIEIIENDPTQERFTRGWMKRLYA